MKHREPIRGSARHKKKIDKSGPACCRLLWLVVKGTEEAACCTGWLGLRVLTGEAVRARRLSG